MTELAQLIQTMGQSIKTVREIAESAPAGPARDKMMRRVRLRERQIASVGAVH